MRLVFHWYKEKEYEKADNTIIYFAFCMSPFYSW